MQTSLILGKMIMSISRTTQFPFVFLIRSSFLKIPFPRDGLCLYRLLLGPSWIGGGWILLKEQDQVLSKILPLAMAWWVWKETNIDLIGEWSKPELNHYSLCGVPRLRNSDVFYFWTFIEIGWRRYMAPQRHTKWHRQSRESTFGWFQNQNRWDLTR